MQLKILETGYNYFKANYEEIIKYAQSRNWDSLLYEQEVDSTWKSFKSELLLLRNKFVPKYKKNKNRCNGLQRKLLGLEKLRSKLGIIISSQVEIDIYFKFTNQS